MSKHPDDGCVSRGQDLGADLRPSGVILLSEGDGDCRFLHKLLKANEITGITVARPVGGKDFHERLNGWRDELGSADTIIVVRDSDDRVEDSIEAVRKDFASARYTVPSKGQCDARRFYGTAGEPRFAIVTLPFDAPGELETLIVAAMKEAYPREWGIVEQWIGGLDEKPSKADKARLACLIALTYADQPACAVSRMFESSHYQPLLKRNVFTPLVSFLTSLVPAVSA